MTKEGAAAVNLNEVVNAAHGHLGGSAEFTWQCWGTNAQYIELTQAGEQIGSCVFDRVSGAVYAVELFDTLDRQAWRWVDPRGIEPWQVEARMNNVDLITAWDSVKFQDVSDAQALVILDRMTRDPA